jgi:hypothetical protein
MKVRRMLCPVLLAAAAACGSGGRASDGGAAGIATVIDSTGDSVVARVAGEVPAGALRHLSEELRIAPGADDTSLFTVVASLRIDPQGRAWVFDQPTKSFFVFGSDGKLVHRVGRDGAGPGEFRQYNGMVFQGDTGIAVLDASNARISFLDSAGTFLTSWVVPSGFSTNDGLLTDRSGALLLRRPVTAPREGEMLGRMGVVRLRAGGGLGDSLAPPDLAVPRDVYVATSKDGRGKSSTSAPFSAGYHWAWHPAGHFVVADGGKYEVIVARSAGKPLVIRRDASRAPIGPEERAEERAKILHSMRATNPDWSWSGPPVPEAKAPMDQLLIARDGRLWIRVPVASEQIPEAELTPPRDPTRPVTHFRTPQVYEVFSPEGRFLGRVALPRRTRFIEADGDLLWAIGQDENDLPAVVRFRITPGLQ